LSCGFFFQIEMLASFGYIRDSEKGKPLLNSEMFKLVVIILLFPHQSLFYRKMAAYSIF